MGSFRSLFLVRGQLYRSIKTAIRHDRPYCMPSYHKIVSKMRGLASIWPPLTLQPHLEVRTIAE